jgi:hypothetical protein
MNYKTETETINGRTFKFTPVESGEYNFEGQKCLVVDPCYILQDDYGQDPYDGLCRASRPTYEPENRDKNLFIEMECEGEYAFIFGTRYGDGCYPVSQNQKLIGKAGVDAGILGVFPETMLKKIDVSIDGKQLGVVVDGVDGAVDHDNGNVTLGGLRNYIEVVTGEEAHDEEEEEEEEYSY